jgi:hypothetical protein
MKTVSPQQFVRQGDILGQKDRARGQDIIHARADLRVGAVIRRIVLRQVDPDSGRPQQRRLVGPFPAADKRPQRAAI